MVPSVVVKMTLVPLCGGVPDASSSWAVIVAVPFVGSAVVADVSVIVDPVGARNGAFSHADRTRVETNVTATRSECRLRGIMSAIKYYFSCTYLVKTSRRPGHEPDGPTVVTPWRPCWSLWP